MEITADFDGTPTTVLVKVLHPLLCLKSRIINMLHPATRRSDLISRMQALAATVIVRRFIDDALEEGGDARKEALDCFRQLYWYLRSDEFVKVSDTKLGIDPLTILQRFADDTRIDQRNREMQIKRMIANIQRRRSRRDESAR
jgi:hypothetical protein